MNLGLLVLRVIVGALFIGHGAQKLLRWFGGHGPQATGSFFESVGISPGKPMAILAGAAESLGGLLFALGLLTPLAAMLLISVMAVAVATVHWSKGVWAANGGFEYNLVMAAAAFAVTAIGAGRWSLDRVLAIHLVGAGWALASLAAALACALVTIAFGRIETRRHTRHATPTAA
ncbi:MAG TPA: DoxX family protein [Solirubrobacteraceae bacterium]|nr:DoxX family protein [Solirubrobacteraceae bacterium]